jgi:hypothetical protein
MASEKQSESPAAWFAALERAIRTGNFGLARRCEDELKKLGVEVSIRPSMLINLQHSEGA